MIYIIVPFRDLPRQPHMVSAASSLSPSGAMLAGRRLALSGIEACATWEGLTGADKVCLFLFIR
jgi:hypothetical protein